MNLRCWLCGRTLARNEGGWGSIPGVWTWNFRIISVRAHAQYRAGYAYSQGIGI